MKRWIMFLAVPLLGVLVMMSAGISVWRSADFPLRIKGDASCLEDIEIQTDIWLRGNERLRLSLKQGKTSYVLTEQKNSYTERCNPFREVVDKDSVQGRRPASEQEKKYYEQAISVYYDDEAEEKTISYIGSLTIKSMYIDVEELLYSSDSKEDGLRNMTFERDGKKELLQQKLSSNEEWILIEETRVSTFYNELTETEETSTNVTYSLVSTDEENPAGYMLGETYEEDELILYTDDEKGQGYYVPSFYPMYERENHLYFFDEDSKPKVKEAAALDNERIYDRIMMYDDKLLLLSQDEDNTYLTFYDKAGHQKKELTFSRNYFSTSYDFTAGSVYRNGDYLIWHDADIYVVDLRQEKLEKQIEEELIMDQVGEESYDLGTVLDLYYKKDTLYVLEHDNSYTDEAKRDDMLTIKAVRDGKQACRAEWEIIKAKESVDSYSNLWLSYSSEVIR